MADTYGEDTAGRLPYPLLYERLKAEADGQHADSYVTPISLGSVRTLVAMMERFTDLQTHVVQMVVSTEDGGVEEAAKLVVAHCGDCHRLVLTQPKED